MTTHVSPRNTRIAASLAAVGGLLALAGCASTAADADPTVAAPEQTTAAAAPTAEATTPTPTASSEAENTSGYKDGSYTADGQYQTPHGTVESVTVTVALKDGVVESVDVTGQPIERETEQYQSKFIGGIAAEVVGKSIDDLSVSRVAGSSLTSGGFNKAIEEIKQEAAS
ncbi:FMN-binding protein [Microbacterium gorillae]|uniref:FMN-binding protein n=1 Tax=Microbacterium gorillae TaxID=1231063 RepID=UPI00058CF094|nr:FMN-binding protein [Microbacterium gorillae]